MSLVRYGRRGGRWAEANGITAQELDRIRRNAGTDWPDLLDAGHLFTPETIAAARAHDQQCAGKHRDGERCTAVPDVDDVTAIWQGRARMASARLAAGLPLDVDDERALARARGATT